MIIRTARSSLHPLSLQRLQTAAEHLTLPWLCPALVHRSRHRWSITRLHPTRTPIRHYAVAALAEAEDIPWDPTSFPPEDLAGPEAFPPPGTLSQLPEFDPTQPLTIADTLRPTPRRFRSHRGLVGDLADIHQILHACLQIGQLSRAATTVQRLTDLYDPLAEELTAAHNAYLRALVSKLSLRAKRTTLQQVYQWFQDEMQLKGVRFNETTLALLVQAGLYENTHDAKAIKIRQYLSLARQANLLDETVVDLRTRLSDEHLALVIKFHPAGFIKPQDPSGPLTVPSRTKVDPDAVQPQAQKGLGLLSLQRSLSSLSVGSGDPLTPAQEALLERQRRLERDTTSSALARWRQEHDDLLRKVGTPTSLSTRGMGAILWSWHEALLPLIQTELRAVRRVLDGPPIASGKEPPEKYADRLLYGPGLRFLTAETLSALTIVTVINDLARLGVKQGVYTTGLVLAVGSAVEDEAASETVKRQQLPWFSDKQPAHQRKKRLTAYLRREGLDTSAQISTGMPTAPVDWSPRLRAKLGAALVSMLLQVAKITTPQTDNQAPSTEPAFRRTIQFQHGARVAVIQANDHLAEKLASEPFGSNIAKHLPMLVPPRPWTDYKEGGFLEQPQAIVRLWASPVQSREYIRLAARTGDMQQVFAGLNYLGRTPWRINRAVFKVMRQLWNSGEGIAGIPPAKPELKYPEPLPEDANKQTRRIHSYKIKRLEAERDGIHSNRCFQNFQLETAQAYLNDVFYLPHNLDFRGRAYPMPPYLNHVAADNCRGLLMFGEGRRLGERGLFWLHVHLANVFGFDKASLDERHAWTVQHMDDIRDSALNSLEGRRWWLKAEDPWQCLATSIELVAALDHHSPPDYISFLPVHQDGTCNGLQHYAALGGDTVGAQQVNLEPGDRPSDIYTAVSTMIQEQIDRDAETGHPYAPRLVGRMRRKIVKQTVMTNVYGVTYIGAKKQVRRQIEDLLPGVFSADSMDLENASGYVAQLIFKTLGRMFNGASAIQAWLGDCASKICESLTAEQVQQVSELAQGRGPASKFKGKSSNAKETRDEHLRARSAVIWTTPLRMPIVQPYRRTKSRRITTNLHRLSLQEPTVSDPVHRKKQMQGFPPNFIHSLDATHMLLSALRCEELGLIFASVHDSYWTHAASVDGLSVALRDSFHRMHSEDIIGRLRAEFVARYGKGMTLHQVKKNSVLGAKINAWRRKEQPEMQRFNIGASSQQRRQTDELLMEKRRLDLLGSDDPAERAKGEAMITPYALWAQTTDQAELLYDPTVDCTQRRPKDSNVKLTGKAKAAQRRREKLQRKAQKKAEKKAAAAAPGASSSNVLSVVGSSPAKVEPVSETSIAVESSSDHAIASLGEAKAGDTTTPTETTSEVTTPLASATANTAETPWVLPDDDVHDEVDDELHDARELGPGLDLKAHPSVMKEDLSFIDLANSGSDTLEKLDATASEKTSETNGVADAPKDQERIRQQKLLKEHDRNRRRALIWFWAPVTFDAVPEKGSFDVSKVRDSTYFFS